MLFKKIITGKKMLFPYATTNILYKRPIVTELLVIVNILVYILCVGSGDYKWIIETFGFTAGSPSAGDMITSMFIHAGFFHLIGNMLYLYLCGSAVEEKMGRVRYILFYLASGIIANLIFYLMTGTTTPNQPLVGASGAVAGVLGAYFILYPFSDFKVFYWLFFFYSGTIEIAAFFFIGAWILFQVWEIVKIYFLDIVASNIAYWAHIGGFFFGSVLATVFYGFEGQKKINTGGLGRKAKNMNLSDVEVFKKSLEKLIFQKKYNEAERLYLKNIKKFPELILDPGPQFDLAKMLDDRGLESPALEAYEKLINKYPDAPVSKRAYLFIGKLAFNYPEKHTWALKLLYDFLESKPVLFEQEEAKQYIKNIETKTTIPKPEKPASEEKVEEPSAEKSKFVSIEVPKKPKVKNNTDGYLVEPKNAAKPKDDHAISIINAPLKPDIPTAPFINFSEEQEEKKENEVEETVSIGRFAKIEPKIIPSANEFNKFSRFNLIIEKNSSNIDISKVAEELSLHFKCSIEDASEQIKRGKGILLKNVEYDTADAIFEKLISTHQPVKMIDITTYPSNLETVRAETGDFKKDYISFSSGFNKYQIEYQKIKFISAAVIARKSDELKPLKVIDIFSENPDTHIRMTSNVFSYKLPTSETYISLNSHFYNLLKFIVSKKNKAHLCHNLENILTETDFALNPFETIETYDNYNEWMLMQVWKG